VTDPGRRHRIAPRRVDKPWGHELVFAETAAYAGKLLSVDAGHSLSLQYHERKDESWHVLRGRATLELGEVGGARETVELLPGDCYHFPPGTVHRVTALEDTLIVEVSTPELEDVVRLEDRYGRAAG
jgi:mannose-6-phosphate isomerase